MRDDNAVELEPARMLLTMHYEAPIEAAPPSQPGDIGTALAQTIRSDGLGTLLYVRSESDRPSGTPLLTMTALSRDSLGMTCPGAPEYEVEDEEQQDD